MAVKHFYADNFFKDEDGSVYTEQYIDHNEHIRKWHTFTKVENPLEELQGVKVSCNYSQIFYPDSNMLLCNDIREVDETIWDNIESGELLEYFDADGNPCEEEDAEETTENEIFQFYLIDRGTAQRLMRSTNEVVMYSDMLNLYVLGVTHLGTAWDYVGTEFVY